MNRKTREDKVLEKTEKLIEEQKQLNVETVPLESYEDLYVEYRRLTKRYKKTLKINDSMSSQIIRQNEDLEEDNKKIIKVSREKILSTVAEKRDLQQKMSEKISDQNRNMLNLKKEIKNYQNYEMLTKSDNDLTPDMELAMAHNRIKSLESDNSSLKTKVQEIKKFIPTMESTLSKEMSVAKKTGEPLMFCMLGIDNFHTIKDKINTFTTYENFILGILKYIQNSLKQEDIVAHLKGEVFYIISHNTTIDHMEKICQVIGRRRTINSLNISLSSGITQMQQGDTTNDMIIKCSTAFKKALNSSRDGSVELLLEK